MSVSIKEVCVIGVGRFGKALIEELVERNINILAIDNNEENLEFVSDLALTTLKLNVKTKKDLIEAGVDQFDTVVVSTVKNVEIVSILKEIGIKNIVAKASSKRHEKILLQIGATSIVRPEVEAGIRTALSLLNENINKYTKEISEMGDDYIFCSTKVKNAEWCKQIKELNLTKRKTIISIINRNNKIIIPNGEIELKLNDKIYLIGKNQNITSILEEINEEPK